MRKSVNHYKDGRLYNGYDYNNQAWVQKGKYISCNHPNSMNCNCYGKMHAGEETKLNQNNIDMNLYQYNLLKDYANTVEKIYNEYFQDDNFAYNINQLNLSKDFVTIRKFINKWRNDNENF